MNQEQVKQIVDEVVEGLLEGGPGSGPQKGATRADREKHSKGAGADHFSKVAFQADELARKTPIHSSSKVKRHVEAIDALKKAANKGDEKYQAAHEARIVVHEKMLKQAKEYRTREREASRKMSTYEFNGFTFKKPT